MRRRITLVGVLGMVTIAIGCASQRPLRVDPTTRPISLQLRAADPALHGQTFRPLLDFETAYDQAVVKATPPAAIDASHAHTGRAALRLAPRAELTLPLAAMLSGRPFPGHWTLLGGYFYAPRGAKVSVRGLVESRPAMTIPPGKWMPVMVDVSRVPQAVIGDDSPASLAFAVESAADVWFDDALVCDNTRTLVNSGGWLVRQRGFEYAASRKPFFEMRLKSAETHASGWKLIEANDIRACFTSVGKPSALVVYSDGRRFADGVYQPLVGPELLPAGLARQHASPGEISVPEELGRVERTIEGDQNNDGYNELRGAYQIKAAGPRLQVTLTPAGATLITPVLEIAGLPDGQVLATMEGRLVSRIVRTDAGHVLVELPGQLDRPTTVSITVKPPNQAG